MRATPSVRRVPRPTIQLLLQLCNLQKQDRTRIIYSKAITADDSASRKIELFGQIQFTLLGTEGRDSKQPERCLSTPRVGFRSTSMAVCSQSNAYI